MANIKMVHIPFKGAPSAALGVIGGQVEMALLNLPPTLPQVKSGRLKGLAVTTAKRTSAIPELPTIAEAGVPGYEASTWYGVMAPAGTPNEITDDSIRPSSLTCAPTIRGAHRRRRW